MIELMILVMCLLPISRLSRLSSEVILSLEGYASQTNIYLVSLLQKCWCEMFERWNKEVAARRDFSIARQPLSGY